MSAQPNEGDLKVWWVPQIPMPAFEVAVTDIGSASLLLDTLGQYDAFQFEHHVKPDYCNAGGLMVFEDGDWCDWLDDEGNDFDEVRRDPEMLAAAIAKARGAA